MKTKLKPKRTLRKKKLKKKVELVQSRCSVCLDLGYNSAICDGYFKLGYPAELVETLHSRALGLPMEEVKDLPKVSAPVPNVGDLKGIDRHPQPGQTTLYATAPSSIYPKSPHIPLEGIRPIQVLRWAEQWRDFYEGYGSCGCRSHFLTVEALHNMILHSTLPNEDHPDAHAILQALYPEESSCEAAGRRREWDQSEARLRSAAETKKKTEVETVHVFASLGNEWGISVEKNTTKYKIFDFPVTSVIRWMGADAWTEADATLALNRLGLDKVSINTIKAQLRRGRNSPKDNADLTSDQDAKLNSVIAPKKTNPKPEETLMPKNSWKSKGSRGKGAAGKESKPPKSKPNFGSNRAARRNHNKKGGKSS